VCISSQHNPRPLTTANWQPKTDPDPWPLTPGHCFMQNKPNQTQPVVSLPAVPVLSLPKGAWPNQIEGRIYTERRRSTRRVPRLKKTITLKELH
jgi:hypothetical protein